mmetsp:Transcript_94436/g.187179  ORF Transcript_94436/g.187179 Transcript_94436/m.187179 type:complete len:305 (-) Transcript_94436:82-996(-)
MPRFGVHLILPSLANVNRMAAAVATGPVGSLRGTAAQGSDSSLSLRALFRVAATEHGQERSDLPLWALSPDVPATLTFPRLLQGSDSPEVHRHDLPGVTGGFQLTNVLSKEECQSLVDVLDALGFHADAAVSLPYSFRHMVNCNLCVPDDVERLIFERCRHLLPEIAGCEPLGLNCKFRCYKYGSGDYFKPHTDGAWPGTRVEGEEVLMDAFGDRLSQLTFLILLSDDYEGGGTKFYDSSSGEVETRTPLGGVLCFPHGYHPDSPMHEGMLVHSGYKYMIRTEVLYSLQALHRLRQSQRESSSL